MERRSLPLTDAGKGESVVVFEDFRARAEAFVLKRGYILAIAAAFVVAFGLRLSYVAGSGFPLNDGGLFYTMTRDLLDHGFSLPAFTSYNAANIPFDYPPFGFYAAAMVHRISGIDLLDLFRFLPLIATCLTVPAFFLLARELLPSRLSVVVAVVAFAFIPRSYIWLLMGGGITRSFGLLFAILALHQFALLYRKGRPSNALGGALFASLTLLSHLETAWFLAFSLVIFVLAFGCKREAIGWTAIAASISAGVTAPWWLTAIANHGIGPFLAAQSTGGSFLSSGDARTDSVLGVLRFVSTSEPFFPVIGVLAFVGVLGCLASRRFLLPAWWGATVLLDVRAFPTFTTLPIAMLAGIGLVEVVLPGLSFALATGREEVFARPYRTAPAAFAVGALLLLYVAGASLVRSPDISGESSFLVSLSPDERAAMAWVAAETSPASRFLLVPDTGWETAETIEWFPVLANRVSVDTVQGSEWLPGGVFSRKVAAYNDAFDCGFATTACLEGLEKETPDFSHVYLRKSPRGQCCYTLMTSLHDDPDYQLVYDGPGATIFERRGITQGDPLTMFPPGDVTPSRP